ncbi:MAG: tetratricopeptide repeat protein [Spirochaetes bacterium]|nr:tetratricopeptide repeat protein [Spirochaetota bacterium]
MRRHPPAERAANRIGRILQVLTCLCLLACQPRPPSDDLVAEYLAAKDDYAGGDLQKAEQRLTRIVARDAGFHQAAFLLGKIYYFEDKPAEARRAFTALVKRYGRYNEAEIWLARTLVREGAIEAAQRRVEELLSFDQSDPRLLFLRGSLALETSDLKNALEFFQRAADFGEELARAHLEIARLYYQFDLPDKALEELALCRSLTSNGSLLRDSVDKLIATVGKEAEAP